LKDEASAEFEGLDLACKSERSKTALMLIVHVHVQVRPESVQQFIDATLENARNSIQEPGIARFDIIQQSDDPTRFVFVEVYRDEAATKAHKETAHYAKWRDTVAPMMSAPRTSVRFSNLFPEDKDW
jgi:(4S)-4-hydroxy-5-phosphonooxypentane-2,3-dione isomerase